MNPLLTPFHQSATGTWTWVIEDVSTRAAAIVDPALDFNLAAGAVGTLLADAVIAHVHARGLAVQWILETHAHADHLSAAQYLKRQLGGRVGIGAGIVTVQRHFKAVFNLDNTFAADGTPFDHCFADGEDFNIGSLQARALATPGHTSDAMTYVVGDAALIGDTLFAPDVGSARCDFPGGDAGILWDSIQRILALADDTRLCLAHDYPPADRELRAIVPLAQMRAENIHIVGRDRASYVAMRRSRDASLPVPQLLYPALQVNIRGGHLPMRETNGRAYLRLPIDPGGA